MKVAGMKLMMAVIVCGSAILLSWIGAHFGRPSYDDKLFKAALHGDLRALTSGAGNTSLCDARDPYNNTVLHWAAKGGHVSLCEFLLDEHSCDVHVVNQAGTSVLHWAVYPQQNSLIVMLLSRGVAPNTVNANLETALHWAIDWDRPESVAALLRAGADPNPKDINGDTPLHRITKDCTEEMACASLLKDMLAHGADAAAVNKYGRVALAHLDWAANNADQEP